MPGQKLFRLSALMLLLSISSVLVGCATPVKCQCPEPPKVPKFFTEPSKNEFLLAPMPSLQIAPKTPYSESK